MTEEKSEKCSCGCNCKCGSNKMLLTFFLFVIVILLSGIFYTMQGMMAMCEMKMGGCSHGKTKMVCPLMNKGQSQY